MSQPTEEFTHTESTSGILLLVMTVVALVLANSGLHEEYVAVLETHLALGTGPLTMSVHEWISDGLMALFFFLVGLEIKREFISGELSTWKHATLPLFAALGGMVMPALIFSSFNAGTEHARGWGIPMATDIAFALGVVTLLGRRVPIALKVFLIALAIIDDIGAVIVIAVFYTRDIDLGALLGGLSIIGVLYAGNGSGIRTRWFYSILGVGVWYLFLQSGIHATIAGVLVAFTVPGTLKGKSRPSDQPTLARFEHGLRGFVAYGVIPIFILANAGVRLSSDLTDVFISPLGMGVILGLVIGKPVGIVLFSVIAIKFGMAELPTNTKWSQMLYIGLLGGIGFTMSVFITGLAYSESQQIADAKLSIFLASIIATVFGWAGFSFARRQKMPQRG